MAADRLFGFRRFRVERFGLTFVWTTTRSSNTDPVTQVFCHVPGRCVPICGTLRERFETDPLQLPGNRVVHLPWRPSLDCGDLLQKFGQCVTPERSSSRQQFVKDNAQTENVAPAINAMSLAASLFRTHVGGRAGGGLSFAHILLA